MRVGKEIRNRPQIHSLAFNISILHRYVYVYGLWWILKVKGHSLLTSTKRSIGLLSHSQFLISLIKTFLATVELRLFFIWIIELGLDGDHCLVFGILSYIYTYKHFCLRLVHHCLPTIVRSWYNIFPKVLVFFF